MSVLAHQTRRAGWHQERLGRLAPRSKACGTPDLESLSVFLGAGVVPRSAREDNHNELGADLSRYLTVRPGDIVFNKLRTWQGGLGVSRHHGIVSPAYYVLNPGTSLYPGYVHYLLQSAPYLAEFTRLSKWMPPSQFDIGWEQLRDVPVLLPPLEEQRRIADFLDDQVTRIDAAISARAEQLELIKERRAQSIRLGVAGALDGPRVNTDLPWSPERAPDAQARALARIVTLQRGVDLTADERVDGPFSVVTSGGVVGYHHRAIVPSSGVVVGRYGSGGSVFWVNGPHWPHNTTLYVRDYQGNVARWVFYLLSAFPYDALQARAAVPGINRNDMAGQLMPWLPIARQREAVARLDEVLGDLDSLSSGVEASSRTLQERKRALITAAVTGEFDVSTAGPRAAAAVTA